MRAPAGDFEPKLHRDNDSYDGHKYSKPNTFSAVSWDGASLLDISEGEDRGASQRRHARAALQPASQRRRLRGRVRAHLHTYRRADARMHGSAGVRTHGHEDEEKRSCTDTQTHGRTSVQKHRCTDAQTHRRTDART